MLVRYKAFWMFALGFFFLDQATKSLVLEHIPYGTYIFPEPIPAIKGFLYWVHVHNTGAAWGSFSGSPLILGIFAIIVLVALYFFRKKLELEKLRVQVSLGMMVGGILGNLLDRFSRGYVIDFIDVHLPGYRWPAFNIADCGISVGIILYLILSFIPEKRTSGS